MLIALLPMQMNDLHSPDLDSKVDAAPRPQAPQARSLQLGDIRQRRGKRPRVSDSWRNDAARRSQ